MNTPRTDAAERKAHGISDDFELLPNLYVPGDFARQLETELAAMTALADRLAKTLWKVSNCRIYYEGSMDIDTYTTDEVKEALASYEKHKKGNTP